MTKSWDPEAIEEALAHLEDLGARVAKGEYTYAVFVEGNTSFEPDYQATTLEELQTIVAQLRAARQAAVAKKLEEAAAQRGVRRRYIVMPKNG